MCARSADNGGKSDNIQVVLDVVESPVLVASDAKLNEANLLGQGDSSAYTNTEGSNAFDASYVFPLIPQSHAQYSQLWHLIKRY